MNNATILVVEDDHELLEALRETLQIAGYRVVTASDGQHALTVLAENKINLVVSDIQMPNMDGRQLLKQIRQQGLDVPIILMTAYGTIQQAVDAMRDGASDYMVKPFEAEVLANMVSRYVGHPEENFSDMIAEDPASRELVQIAKRVADSDATVLITGESGAGKEVLARYIHMNSSRANKPFVAINCAAIPENMLEATLFGYDKGAYTGAYKASPGKFELANGGTLLLDEISEMDLGLQAKLLRVLQEREVERLGGNSMIQLDVRVLATSNRDMRTAVENGEFREDLYYRLNVFPMHVKSLAERRGDIVPLANRLLEKHAQSFNRSIPALNQSAAARLTEYDWPGNVRELDNVIQRCLILQSGDVIDSSDIQFEFTSTPKRTITTVEMPTQTAPATTAQSDSLNSDLKQREWDLIIKAIRDAGGSRKRTAERLGISQRTLRYKLARMREAGIAIPGSVDVEAV
ncbi:MAG: sigma-54 dependent transcriptional regulator [Gammaproteobacteria bacterium]|nr:sigma-54 dependent transcriptional regulator [Gammaproteobacteria bacterium]MDH5652945.1 sigma-54 dependent transcriptional regulator [Gammaproteobacteria bacterium]